MKFYEKKETSLLCSSDLKTAKGKFIYFFMLAVLIIMAFVVLIPVVWIILTALKETQEIYQGFTFFPKKLSWEIAAERVKEAWNVLKLGRTVFNTLILCIGNVLFANLFCGLGGYVMSRMKPKGSKFIFALMVWSMMLPAQIRLVPLYISYIHFPFASAGGISILDSYWPMWLAQAAGMFTVLLYKNNFDGISISLVEAARIDGCTDFGIFWKIMMPLSIPVFIYVSIGAATMAWSNFFTPYLVLKNENLMTLPIMVYRLASDTRIKMNTYMMCLMLSSIPSFLIFVLFQRHIVGGVNIGGVKG